MKAFQLKITIKNSKPLIWRRVIIPAGITFSQLSMILNKAMGWSGEHLFDMEFYHQQVRIIEGADEFGGWGPFDYLEASTTFIREFLEENDWFTYTYDLGDNWEHRVTVEKVLTDYELDYPQVIKFKGNCPPEDCGGIYGYYYLMDVVADKNHPDYEEQKEWLGDDPKEYNMAEVNEELKKHYFYKWGKAEKRRQQEIYEDHYKRKYGLCATKKDKNRTVSALKHNRDKLEEMFQVMEDIFEGDMFNYEKMMENILGISTLEDSVWQDVLSNTSLNDIFSKFSKNDLVAIAKEKGLKSVSKCKKEVLIEKIVDYMLKPEIVEWYFSCLTDKELEVFEGLMKKPEEQKRQDIDYLEKIYRPSYIGMLANGTCMVPKNVKEAYGLLPKEQFEQKRKRKSYLLSCVRAAGLLYGITPIKVILDMMKTDSEINITEHEVKSMIENIPPEFNEYVVDGDKIYHKELYPDDSGLLNAQGEKPYYIPTKQEILDLGVLGYLPQKKELKNFIHFLIHTAGLLKEHAEYVGIRVQCEISKDCGMQGIFEILEEEMVYTENARQLNKMIELLNNLWNNTRMLLNRGFTPNELSKQGKNNSLPLAEKDNVISFEQAKKKKIYPNDPCPCGSGKKYKNCCGEK